MNVAETEIYITFLLSENIVDENSFPRRVLFRSRERIKKHKKWQSFTY